MEFMENEDKPDISDVEEEANLSDDNSKLHGYNQWVYFLIRTSYIMLCAGQLNCWGVECDRGWIGNLTPASKIL